MFSILFHHGLILPHRITYTEAYSIRPVNFHGVFPFFLVFNSQTSQNPCKVPYITRPDSENLFINAVLCLWWIQWNFAKISTAVICLSIHSKIKSILVLGSSLVYGSMLAWIVGKMLPNVVYLCCCCFILGFTFPTKPNPLLSACEVGELVVGLWWVFLDSQCQELFCWSHLLPRRCWNTSWSWALRFIPELGSIHRCFPGS